VVLYCLPGSLPFLSTKQNRFNDHASADSRLGGLFVPVPTTTKRLKISGVFYCVTLGTMSHSGCKGYCLQDLRRPSFPFQEGLLQHGETARRREKEEGGDEMRGGRVREQICLNNKNWGRAWKRVGRLKMCKQM